MKARQYTRPHPYVIDTRTRRGWRWPVGAITALLLLLALGGYLDSLAEEQQISLLLEQVERDAELAQAFEDGRSAGHADMVASSRAAWRSAGAPACQFAGAAR